MFSGSALASTRNVWVKGKILSNGVYRNGHYRIYDYLSYRYPNNTSFWTVNGDYYRQGQGVDKDPYFKGKLRPEAQEFMDKIRLQEKLQ